MRGLKNVAFAVMIVGILAMPLLAGAATVPTVPPSVPDDPVTLSVIERIIQRILTFLVTFGVIIGIGMIIAGGIRWMAAAGNDDRAASAKEMIKHGIYGVAIVLGVGVILQTIASFVNLDFFGI